MCYEENPEDRPSVACGDHHGPCDCYDAGYHNGTDLIVSCIEALERPVPVESRQPGLTGPPGRVPLQVLCRGIRRGHPSGHAPARSRDGQNQGQLAVGRLLASCSSGRELRCRP